MKNIGILGDYTKTSNCIDSYISPISNIYKYKIFPTLSTSSDFLLNPDIFIINHTFNLHRIKYFIKPTAIILNLDKLNNSNTLYLPSSELITVGFSPKSTLTVSSISTSNFTTILCYLQRTIFTLNNKKIPEQEFIIETKSEDLSIILSLTAMALMLDIDSIALKNVFL